MKILVVGNCQARQITRCLKVLLPDCTVNSLNYGQANFKETITKLAPEYDRVVSHVAKAPSISSALDAIQIHYWIPRITFSAFHPDFILPQAGSHKIAPPPVGGHSSIALACWKNGLSPEAAAERFCVEVYQSLGFFKYSEKATFSLLKEGTEAGFKLDSHLANWKSKGCFMHIPNHPVLSVIADVALGIVSKLGLEPVTTRPTSLLTEQLINGPVWPVYPGIAEQFGIKGDFCFKPRSPDGKPAEIPKVLNLDQFIRSSYEAFANSDPKALAQTRFDQEAYRQFERPLLRAAPTPVPVPPPASETRKPSDHPYRNLPDFHFWKRSISGMSIAEVDPVVALPWTIGGKDVICTAGSCFAQHISNTLSKAGLNYRDFEPAPPGWSESEARAHGYGVYSARYANLYTTRQLRQLFERAFGTFHPNATAWQRPDGRLADPFRPEIEPNGFVSIEELEASRATHLAAVRDMFQSLDVFIFTLGLTEAWMDRQDDAVFPLAPGVVAGTFDPERHVFKNFTKDEVLKDLKEFLQLLRKVNPSARMIVTVSPVPLAATYENRSVLVSTLLSKSVLRVACDEFVREEADTFYFPSLDLITGMFHRGKYYAEDLRSVTQEGVDHVMRLFLKHGVEAGAAAERKTIESDELLDVVCEEENLDS